MFSKTVIFTLSFLTMASFAYGQPIEACREYNYTPGLKPNYLQPSQPYPENCGTPDEPKSCPPLPRNPLPYYPDYKD